MSYKIDYKNTDMKKGGIRVRTEEMTDPKGEETSHVQVSMHCSDLDMTQTTKTLGKGRKKFKVKKIKAYDADGNSVELNIFFDA